MERQANRGVTLVELLVTIAILSMVLAGIYGLLTAAYQSYNHTRAKLESQQTARMVLDYLVYRLREVDGGKSTSKPNQCTDCHAVMGNGTSVTDPKNNSKIPCVKDVSVPQKMPDILQFKKRTFPALAAIPTEFQSMTGNFIQFKADLLPVHGFNESFTDSPTGTTHNSKWDWKAVTVGYANNSTYDRNKNGGYDPGEPELLEDMNKNNQHDYFGETWTFELRTTTTAASPYYQLVESLNLTSLQPRTKKANSKLLYDNSAFKNSSGYSKIPVAYGITGLRIEKVTRMPSPRTFSSRRVSVSCAHPKIDEDATKVTACHGSSVTGNSTSYGDNDRPLNVYGNATSMNENKFIESHPFWNIGGLSVEVTTVDVRGKSREFTKLREFVNFRNLEVNQ